MGAGVLARIAGQGTAEAVGAHQRVAGVGQGRVIGAIGLALGVGADVDALRANRQVRAGEVQGVVTAERQGAACDGVAASVLAGCAGQDTAEAVGADQRVVGISQGWVAGAVGLALGVGRDGDGEGGDVRLTGGLGECVITCIQAGKRQTGDLNSLIRTYVRVAEISGGCAGIQGNVVGRDHADQGR